MPTYQIKQGDTLGAIATKNNTTVQNLLSLNPTIKNPDLIQAGASLNLAPQTTTPVPTQTAPVSATAVQTPPAPVTVPTAPTTPAPLTKEDIQAMITATTPAQDAAQTTQNDLLSSLKSAIAKQGTEAARTADLTGQQVNPLIQQQNEVNNLIRGINSSAFSATQTSENRQAPMFAITGEQAQIERQRSAQTYGLVAQSAALSGQIALAQQNVQLALDAEFKPLESQIKYYTTALDVNKENMSAADKKKADALSFALSEYNTQVTNQKAEKTDIYNTMLAAAKNGAPNTVLQQIQNATTKEQAARLAGQYLQTPEDLQFVSGTDNQPAGTFNKRTGVFTPIGGGKGGAPVSSTDLTSILTNNKVSATTKTTVGNILGVIDAATNLAKANPSGDFAGISPINTFLDMKIPFTDINLVPFRDTLRSAGGVKNTGALDTINLRVQQWASGASLTKQQIEQVNKLVPNATDSDANTKLKLNNLVNQMNSYIKGNLLAEGIVYNPPSVDLFGQDQTLQDIFK